jgi:hypothetical protein
MEEPTHSPSGYFVETPSLTEPTQVRPPRSCWCDVFLLFGSVGMYIPFWIVSLVRDLKKLTQADVKPWAWFFVPTFVIAQFWALPRLGEHLTHYEKKVGLEPIKTPFVWWIAFSIILTAILNALDRLENLPLWGTAIALFAFIILYSLLSLRVNRVKSQDPQITSARHLKKYRWWEWLIVIIGTPASAVLFGLLIYQSIPWGVVEKYDVGSVYSSEEHRFSFPVDHVVWTEVTSTEDDEDLVAFTGPNQELYASIYEYDLDSNINELASYRYSQALDLSPKFLCEENQSFIGKSMNVVIVQECVTSILYGSDALFSKIIRDNERVIELYVQVGTPQASKGSIMKSARAAIAGFTVQ